MISDTGKLIEYLSGFVTERRRDLIYRVAGQRTRYLTIVLEDIYKSQNAGAVLRTCECLGIQDVHIIENNNEFTINPEVVIGATKWLDLFKYNKEASNTPGAIRNLRKNGYRIIATSLKEGSQSLEKIDLKKGKSAILFGNEHTGLSETALEMADEYLQIPMLGFTESYNISVSAGIILHHLSQQLRKSRLDWKLDPDKEQELVLQWLRNTIKHPHMLEGKFLKGE